MEEALALRGWQPEDNAWLTETLGVLKPSAARLQPTGQAYGQHVRLSDQVLPEPANYSVTRCYACGYPVADTLWITSDIQNERAAAAGVVPFIFCGRDRFLRLLALGVSEAIVSRTLQLVGSLYL